MKSAYDLLMTAPDEQATRCRIALEEIAQQRWAEAGKFYRYAASEGCTPWHKEAAEMAAHCDVRAGSSLKGDELAATINLAMLPDVCYAVLRHNAPGQRIVIIKRGESGFYPSPYDNVSASALDLESIVSRLNERLGVLDAQREAMLAGSCFGWHVPGANAAICAELAKRAIKPPVPETVQ